MTPAHIAATTALMVQQARIALACHAAGNQVGYQYHRARARVLAELLQDAEALQQCTTRSAQPTERITA